MITRKIIVTSVSGSGKTTQVDKMLELCKTHHITKYKTTTTRKKRPEEIGDEYDFITEADFHQSISDGKFIEHANVYGNLYGLPYLEVSKHLNENTIGILDRKSVV